MTKTPLPLHVDDLTTFTRALARQLGPRSPSHLALMNSIARAAGFQNLQHMRAAQAAARRLEAKPAPAPVDARRVERTLNQFDPEGRLRQWPARQAVQGLALWALWASLPARVQMPEREVNARLNAEHLFEDPATLRRLMISEGLLQRNRDGSDYHRVEQAMPAEAQALLDALRPRRAGRVQNTQ